MGTFSAIVCDHCDARDTTDDGSVPKHDIKNVRVEITIGYAPDEPIVPRDLCASCRHGLRNAIITGLRQMPSAT